MLSHMDFGYNLIKAKDKQMKIADTIHEFLLFYFIKINNILRTSKW